MKSIFESAKTILEQSAPSADQLAALTKVMLSLKQSYSSINAVRSKLDTPTGAALLDIVSVIAGNTTLFNLFVSEFKKNIGIYEDVIDEATKKFTNGVAWELASEVDRRRGEYYVTYDKTTKKMVAYGLTPKGAEKVAKTSKNLDYASADFYADNIMKQHEEIELVEDKLQNDIKSLKRIGWKLDKVIPFLITKGSDYGVKMTSDLISMYYDDGGNKKSPKMAPVKVPKPKKVL